MQRTNMIKESEKIAGKYNKEVEKKKNIVGVYGEKISI